MRRAQYHLQSYRDRSVRATPTGGRNEKRRLIRSAIKALAAVIDNKSFTLPHTCLQYLIPFSVVAKNLKFHQNCTCGSN